MAHNKISDMEDLENNGWEQMSSILDKKMPVNKNRRLAMIWWIGGAAAAIALAISIALPTIIEPELESIPLTESINENKSIDQKELDSKNQDIGNIQTQEITNEIISGPKTTKASIAKIKNAVSAYPTVINDKLTIRESSSQVITNNQNSTSLPNTSLITTSETKKSIPYVKEKFHFEPISNSTQEFTLAQNARKILVPNFEFINNEKFKLGIDILYANSLKKNYSEIGAGISGTLKLNRRWNLQTSLNYSKRGKLFGNQNLSELELADANSFNSGSVSTDPLVSSSRSIDSANDINLSQLSLSIGAQYQFSPKWAIDGSLLPSYTFINDADYNEWYSGPNINNAFIDGSTAPINWNAHLGLGVNYSLSNSMKVGLSYNYLITRKGQNSLLDPNFESDEWLLTMSYLLD